jgi:hypothetical protein
MQAPIATYQHSELVLEPGERLSVRLSRRAKIRLVDQENYHRLREGKRFRYLGRSAPREEVVLCPNSNRPKRWHLVILPEDPAVLPKADLAILAS